MSDAVTDGGSSNEEKSSVSASEKNLTVQTRPRSRLLYALTEAVNGDALLCRSEWRDGFKAECSRDGTAVKKVYTRATPASVASVHTQGGRSSAQGAMTLLQGAKASERGTRLRRKAATQPKASPEARKVTKRERSSKAEKETLSDDIVDVFSLEIPRRPRSQRSPAVVKLRDFSFRDLPTLLDESSQRATKQTVAESQAQKSEDISELRTMRKSSRKPKSDAEPQRLVASSENTPRGAEKRGRRRGSREVRPDEETPRLDEQGAEMASPDEFRAKRMRTRPRGRGRPPKVGFGDGKRSKRHSRRRSLKAVIQACLDAGEGQKVTRREPALLPRTTLEASSSAPDPPCPPAAKFKSKSPAVIKHGDQCPTVACLLTKGALQAGDYVELAPVDTDLRIHGWVTHRGILCSHCALIHMSEAFGECAAVKGDISHLHTKDGYSLSNLMQQDREPSQ